MTTDLRVRSAELGDVRGLARVHVDTWRETYRGLMSNAALDDPSLLNWREKFWEAALTDPKYSQNTIAVASTEGTLVGIAMSGPASEDADTPQQLFVLYVYAAFHGSGVGAALLDAVIDPTAPASLWVADPNPRAQAFYRKNGFNNDGTVGIKDDVRSVRMLRANQAANVRQRFLSGTEVFPCPESREPTEFRVLGVWVATRGVENQQFSGPFAHCQKGSFPV